MKISELPLIALCALPASEMALRFCGNLYQGEKEAKFRYDMAGNIIGAVLLTVCSFDTFPGARLCGSVGFIAYSIFKADPKNSYVTSKPIQKAWEHKFKTMALLAASYAAYRWVPQETVSKTRAIFFNVFSNV